MSLREDLKILLHYSKVVYQERKSLSKARVFFLRAFTCYKETISWLKFIDAFYKKYGFENAPWTIATLPVRAYGANNLSKKQKFALIKSNYDQIEKVFSAELVKKIISEERMRFCTLVDKHGEEHYLEFAALSRNWREGILSIYLTNGGVDEYGSPKAISTISINFGFDAAGKKFMLIGCLQGAVKSKSRIVEVTRGLKGLRPKYLLLECAYFFANIFAVEYVIGISNRNHVFANHGDKVVADYDDFWSEVGGVLNSEKNYSLPRKLPKRSFEEVPQKKRKDWLARQEYLRQVESDFTKFFAEN